MNRKITASDVMAVLMVIVFGGIFMIITLTSPTLQYEACMSDDRNSTVMSVRAIKENAAGIKEYAADLENGKTAAVYIPVYVGDNYCKTFKI